MFRWLYPNYPGGRVAFGLFLLRLVFGLGFMVHGYQKIMDIGSFAAMAGLPMPLAALAAGTEFIGGGLLVIGLLTPLVNIAVVIEMLVAIIKVHLHQNFTKGWELAALYLVVNLAIFFTSPGSFSLDALLSKPKSRVK